MVLVWILALCGLVVPLRASGHQSLEELRLTRLREVVHITKPSFVDNLFIKHVPIFNKTIGIDKRLPVLDCFDLLYGQNVKWFEKCNVSDWLAVGHQEQPTVNRYLFREINGREWQRPRIIRPCIEKPGEEDS